MFANARNERSIPGAVATVGVNERVTFLRKTYGHLGAAVLAFVALEFMLLSESSPLFEAISLPLLKSIMGTGSSASWLVVLGAFMLVSWVANKWALSNTSRAIQYLGLALYVVAEALIFVPLLFIASRYYDGVITDAAVLTLFIFAGLTATVFITKKDFSFMRGALTVASFGALGLIIAGALFGFELGTLFTGLMIVLASGYILFYTSQVLHNYRPSQYVAASLALFSAVALLFWYVLQFIMEMTSD
jgi:FtsH-binding integral membrane protein